MSYPSKLKLLEVTIRIDMWGISSELVASVALERNKNGRCDASDAKGKWGARERRIAGEEKSDSPYTSAPTMSGCDLSVVHGNKRTEFQHFPFGGIRS